MAVIKFCPKVWTLGLKIGVIYVQRGINHFSEWKKKMSQELGEKSIPWLSAIWETLCVLSKVLPEGVKFDEKLMTNIAKYIGALMEEGKAASFEDVQAQFEQKIGKELVIKTLPMIYASYAGIKKFFDNRNQEAEKLTWSFTGKTLTVGGVREIENFPYAKIPWVDHLRDIQRIIIGNGVEKISARAFSECTRLELLELPASVKTIGDMAFSVSFCGSINGVKNVFWCLEDGVLVLKKNPDAPPTADFSTGSVSWIFAEKNIRSVKLEDGVKPTVKFFEWMTRQFNGKEISFK